jgi:VanZ family protein
VLTQTAFWIPLAACTYFALASELPDHPVFELSDMVLHGVAFGYLTFALLLAQAGIPALESGRSLRALVGMLGYGIFIELAQNSIPGRSAELGDLLVDLVGIGLGLVIGAAAVLPLQRGLERLSGRIF